MRRHLVASLALTLMTTSVVSAQSCRNSVITRYPITISSSRIAYLPRTPTVVRYEFGAQQHVDVLAAKLYEQSNDICWEMHRRYSRNVEFDAIYAEMYRIMQDTKHVYDLVRRDTTIGEDRDHIAADLHEMDSLFHHIEDYVARWVPVRSYHYDSGRSIALSLKMNAFEETLHHLMDDYGVRSRISAEAPAPIQNGPAPPPAPIAPLNYSPSTYAPSTYAPSREGIIPSTPTPSRRTIVPSESRMPVTSQPLPLPLPIPGNSGNSYPPLRTPGF